MKVASPMMGSVTLAAFFLAAGKLFTGAPAVTALNSDDGVCEARFLASIERVEFCYAAITGRGYRKTPAKISRQQVMFYEPWYARSANGVTEAARATLGGVYHPHRHVDSYEFALPIKWADDPFEDRSWRARLQSLNIIDPLLLEYEDSGNTEYLTAALEIVLDWNRHHVEASLPASLDWADGPTGIRSAKIGWLYSQAISDDGVSYPRFQVDRLRKLALLHIGKVLSGEVELRLTNHGLFQINGLMVLCAAFEFSGVCDEVDTFVQSSLPRVLRSQYSESGVHLEHSPNYHSFATDKLSFFENSGLYEEFPIIGEVRSSALKQMYWLVDPAGIMWAVGDTFATRPREPVIPSAKPCEPTGHVRQKCVQVWSEDGYVSIKSPDEVPSEEASGLFFQASFHSNVHKHLDDLSFEWFENGSRLLIDSGPIGYKISKMRRYVLSTRAHNTVEIDNKNFSRNNDLAYGSAVRNVENLGTHLVVSGQVFHPDLEAMHDRSLYYSPGEWLAVQDAVESPSARKFVQWFHLAPSLEFISRVGQEIRFGTEWGGELVFFGDHDCPSTIVNGALEPRIQGWYSPSSGEVEPNYALGFVCEMGQKERRTITTIIALDDVAPESVADILAVAASPNDSTQLDNF